MEYWQKLKDPRWKKLRLEAMEKADFHCESCGNGEKTLNVHHKQYFKGREPWDYELKQLITLCEYCHEFEHDQENQLKVISSYVHFDGPRNRDSAAALLSGFIGLTEYKIFFKEDDEDEMCCPIGISPWHWIFGNIIQMLEKYDWTKNSIKFRDDKVYELLQLIEKDSDSFVLYLIDYIEKNKKD